MRRLGTSWMLTALLAACSWALAAAPAAAQSPDSLTRPVAPGGVVSISAREADLTVVGIDGQLVIVRARPETLREVRLEGSGERVLVSARSADDNLEVRVPRGVDVEIRTRHGDIEVRGLAGGVQIESGGGDIRVGGDPSRLRIEGVSSDVWVDGSPRSLSVNTVSGDIEAPAVTGVVKLSTASGDLEVGGRGVSDGTFSTASGDIVFRARPTASAVLSFQTATGDVTIGLPDDVGVSYEITTVGGELTTDRKVELLGSQHFGGGRHYRLSVGDGSVHVSVDAVSGDVHIEGR
jgi:DUF4097 and DUF4098 domain-containing protein YvlB